MKPYIITIFFTLSFFTPTTTTTTTHRRILHQPLFSPSSTPPPSPPDNNPFFHETPDQPPSQDSPSPPYPPPPPPPPPMAEGVATNNAIAPPHPAEKKGVKIAVVTIVSILGLGMVSGMVFFVYKYKLNNRNEELAIRESEVTNVDLNRSPYNKLKSVKTSERYRPSPELQPLPPLGKLQPPVAEKNTDVEEEGVHDFYSTHGSIESSDDGFSVQGLNKIRIQTRNSNSSPNPYVKRASPRSRLSVSSLPENSPAKQIKTSATSSSKQSRTQ